MNDLFIGSKWGASTALGTAGGVVTWSFNIAGARLTTFDGQFVGDAFRGAIRAAFDAWERVADIDFSEATNGANAAIQVGWNAIDGAWNTVAKTVWQNNGASMLEGEIAFDRAEAWQLGAPSGQASIQGPSLLLVAIHEIGHALGLAHSDDPGSVMYPYLDEQTGLAPGDIQAIQAIYGKPVPVAVTPTELVSEVSCVLSAGLRSLQLMGRADISGTGNALDNILRGNAGNNALNGGSGADTMAGGAGNDGYIIDNSKDVVIERAGEGRDKIVSSVSYTLPDNVENMQLTAKGDVSATGNADNNWIGGNSGRNVIGGGAGRDTLFGGGGDDRFVFHAGEAAGDSVGDFSGAGAVGGDVVVFEGYGRDAFLTQVGTSDSYTVHAADGHVAETIRVVGVFHLGLTNATHIDDVLFV